MQAAMRLLEMLMLLYLSDQAKEHMQLATKLWKKLWGVKIRMSIVYKGYLRGILGWLWGNLSATLCEYLLKPAILL